MSLVERLLLDRNVNMEKHKYIELKGVIVNYLLDYHKSSKCGCLMVINYIKFQMDLKKLVRNHYDVFF